MRISYPRMVLVALGLLSFTSLAQESQSPPQGAARPPPRQSEPQQERPKPPPPPSDGRPQPRPGDDAFIPTEELAADEEVTFPVDI